MKLNIAIARRRFLTDLDGVNRFIFTLADGLSALGHEVHVVSYSCRDGSPSQLSTFSREFFDVEGKMEIHTLAGATAKPSLSRIAFAWLHDGSRLLKELRTDAVVVNGILPLRTRAVKLAVNHGMLHGDFRVMTGLRKQLYLQTAKFLYRHNMDVPVCVGPRLKRELKKYMNIDFVVVPLPLKVGLFQAAPLERRGNEVLHVGTRSEKNVDLSIKIIRMLTQEMRMDARLVVVGPRNAYVEHLMKVNEDMIPRCLDFKLDVTSLELRELLSHARALLLPSDYEAYSYAVLEAFASGLPVVVSDAVPRELVSSGRNGFRVHGSDLNLYAARLASLLADDGLWKTISANAVRTASSYSHVRIAEEYERLIEKVHRQR